MTQAQLMARNKLNALLAGESLQHCPAYSLGLINLHDLLKIQRKAKKDTYTITFLEQTKIDVAYDMVFNPEPFLPDVLTANTLKPRVTNMPTCVSFMPEDARQYLVPMPLEYAPCYTNVFLASGIQSITTHLIGEHGAKMEEVDKLTADELWILHDMVHEKWEERKVTNGTR